MTMTEPDQQPDRAWDNKRLILAALAPRTTPRPARRSTPVDDSTAPDTPATGPNKPGLLTRGLRASGRAAAAGSRQFDKRVPPGRRSRTAILTGAALLVALLAVGGVKFLSADVNPQAHTTVAPAPPPPKPTLAPLNKETVLTGVTAVDKCPRDANYADTARAFDGDFSTAWICTRVKNQDGQIIQVDFGRQVTLTQIRAIGGFDATAPDGTDQWSKHRIVTKFEIYFPRDLNRAPVTLATDGVRDWRSATITPPATVSKILIRVAETSDPPQSATPQQESEAPKPDDVTTVAISEIQFIGIDNPHAT